MKIELQDLNKNHLDNLFQTLQENQRFNFCFGVKTRSDLNKWFLELEEKWITAKINNRIVGFVSFEGCGEYKEVQIFLKRKYQCQGYGVIVLTLAEKWARSKFKNLKSINANIASDNVPSVLLFRKCGYHQEWGGDYIKWFY